MKSESEQLRECLGNPQAFERLYRAEHYDYAVQAWVGADGRYLCCCHPASMHCGCYGRLHYGELAPLQRSGGPVLEAIRPVLRQYGLGWD